MNLRAAQIHYGWFERLAMRVLFAFVLERHIPGSLSHVTISAPHGLARIVDFHFLLNPAVFALCRHLLWIALILYVLRLAWVVVLPYLTILSIAVGTIINSQGAIAHYLQIVSLVLGAQTAAHFYDCFQRWRGRREEIPGATDEDRVIFWSQQAIVATYLISALTKLIHTAGKWFWQSPYIAVQIVKTTDQDYYDRLDTAAPGAAAPLLDWIVRHPVLVAFILSLGLLLELTTPLALLGRRWALFYGLSLVAFHESIHRVMKLHFPYNEYLIWIYLVNVPFWTLFAARTARARLRG